MSTLPPTVPKPSPTAAASTRTGRTGWMRLPHCRRRRALFLSVYALFCSSLLAGALATYWTMQTGTPLPSRVDVWDIFYPEIRTTGALTESPGHDDDRFDILLLGGSVLEPTWGEVEPLLSERLEAECPGRWRLFNLARSAHTSRDSLLKYTHLSGQQFDLVFVYDGINDVRMNNVSPEQFRDDYTHCAWYRSFEKRLAAGTMSLPAAIGQQLETLGEAIGRGAPQDETHAEFGREIKTAASLGRNVAEIVRLARERGDAVLLATYAYYIPPDYTRERFDSQLLDYSYRADGRSCGAEMWGRPEFVGPVIDAQNAEVRKLATGDPDTLFVDLHDRMPKAGVNFVDPCHLTAQGSRIFVDNLWPAVLQQIRKWRTARGIPTG